MLLDASIPRLLESFDPEEMLALNISLDRYDRNAVQVCVIGSNRNAVDQMIIYVGSLPVRARFHIMKKAWWMVLMFFLSVELPISKLIYIHSFLNSVLSPG
jgi:hypothetical protein